MDKKYKVLVDGLELNGEKLKKGKFTILPWQTGERFMMNGWVEPLKDGETNETEIDNSTDSGTGKSSRGKKASESV